MFPETFIDFKARACSPILPYGNRAHFKVAPYSFTIACALRTKAQVICARSKENVQRQSFSIFITSTRAQKAKLTVNFLAFRSVIFF